MIQTNTIIHGETIAVMRTLPAESVDLIFADPPYWMRVEGVLNRVNGSVYDGCDDAWDNQFHTDEDYKNFTKNWLVECKRLLKKDGSIWVIGAMQCIYTIGAIMQDLDFWFINDVIWQKTNPTPNFKGTRLNNGHETLIWAVKNKKSKFTFNYKTAKELNTDTVAEKDFLAGARKQLGSVWKINICQGTERIKDEDGKKLHSTQKPEALLYRVLAISSRIGDVILDPFGGTMTTGAVAKRMGRKYICIDSSKKYCEAGRQRIESVQETIGDIEKAVFDIKPPRVTFSEMIEAKYFNAGETLYYKEKDYFLLTNEGKACYPNNEKSIDIHTAIAIVKNANVNRLNGWDYWQVKRDGQFISIDTIRKNYLKNMKGYGS